VQLMCVDDLVVLVIEVTRFELLEVFVDLPDGFRWFGVSIHRTGHVNGMVPLVTATVLLQSHLSLVVHELDHCSLRKRRRCRVGNKHLNAAIMEGRQKSKMT
jgi:hypothetical protein